ncbi:brevican core protein-like isoform X2 [Tachypleus tridentatus]|uniref:brevican core protein-like isoform X2 n=1 Tax=Tachypleus tridentatus TaxID=6853 RepID=UPI003FD2DAA0
MFFRSTVCLLLLHLTFSSQSLHVRHFVKFGHSKKATSGHLEGQYKVSSLSQCSGLCLNNDQCQGLTYSKTYDSCQLLQIISEDLLVTNAEYSVWAKKFGCEEDLCTNGGTCQNNSAGLNSCNCLVGFTGRRCETPPAGYSFYGGSFFKHYRVSKTESQAVSACALDGARLARVPDFATHNFLKTLISPASNTWVDVHKVNGVWQYENGFTSWHTGEPRTDGDCAHMWVNYNMNWNDIWCSENLHYICEIVIY